MADYIISEERISKIADAIRDRTGGSMSMTLAQMPNQIKSISSGTLFEPDEWIRPSDWPNYDLIDRTDFEGIFLTYDLTREFKMACFLLNTDSIVEAGYITENGFESKRTYSATNNSERYELELEPITEGDKYLCIRCTPAKGTHMTNFCFDRFSQHGMSNSSCFRQNCVEKFGRLPHFHNYYYSGYAYRTWASLPSLVSDDVSDISGFTTMYNLYSSCSSLENIKFINWDTSTVESFRNIFSSCPILKSLDLGGWDTSNVTNMRNAFSYCKNLINLNLSGWDCSNVTTIEEMFNDCQSLKNLDLSHLNFSEKLTNMKRFCNQCYSLKTLNISNWNLTNVTDMSQAFYSNERLKNLIFDNTIFPIGLTRIDDIFHKCSSLKDLSFLENLDLSQISIADNTMLMCFRSCFNVDAINLSKTNIKGMQSIDNCYFITINYNGLDWSNYVYNKSAINMTYDNTINYWPPSNFKVSQIFSSVSLSPESVTRIIDALPVVEDALTLKFTSTIFATLTEEQLTAATEKGWTVTT